MTMSDNLILCYCAVVKKRLKTETLARALNHLILYHEMLQVRLENGRYAPEPEAYERPSNKLLSIHNCEGKSASEIETLTGRMIENSTAEMRCSRGESIRAAYFHIDHGFNKLLLLSHRAVVDQRGLILIFEDFYRIYEQLLNGKAVALRPVQKTYTEFINDPLSFGRRFSPDYSETVAPDSGPRPESDQTKTASFNIVFDETLIRRLYSWRMAEFGLAPIEALAGAMLRSLIKANDGNSAGICVKSDYRFADETLVRTAGALTRTYPLQGDFVEEREIFSDIRNLRGVLRDIPTYSSPADSESLNTDKRLRLNLEYLTDEPWLGGDEWLPQGFIRTEKGRFNGNYSIEITPALFSDRIEILAEYRETPEVKAIVDKFAANLAPELEMVLRYCHGYVDAKDFWVMEFAKATWHSKIEIENDGQPVAEKGRASLACRVEKSIMERALLNVEADEPQILLAAYSVLASRLNGCEDLVLLCALDQDGVRAVFPLRLNPVWTSSFKLYVEQVKGKLRRAAAVGQYAFDILSEEQPKRHRPYPVSDLGYVCKQNAVKPIVERSAIGSPAICQSLSQDPELLLEISRLGGDFDVRFIYETSRFSSQIIERFVVYLNAIIEDVAADANVKLGDLEFESDRRIYDAANTLAQDVFKF
jgi:Condensation domain